jgi:PII-like signaling protein
MKTESKEKNTMQGTYLKFYVHENRNHNHMLVYEWLLEQAKKLGIQGGSAFKAIAGFGRHGMLHEDHFFELAGDLPVEVVFIVSEEEAEQLLFLLRKEKLTLFYVKMPVEYGVLGAEENDD